MSVSPDPVCESTSYACPFGTWMSTSPDPEFAEIRLGTDREPKLHVSTAGARREVARRGDVGLHVAGPGLQRHRPEVALELDVARAGLGVDRHPGRNPDLVVDVTSGGAVESERAARPAGEREVRQVGRRPGLAGHFDGAGRTAGPDGDVAAPGVDRERRDLMGQEVVLLDPVAAGQRHHATPRRRENEDPRGRGGDPLRVARPLTRRRCSRRRGLRWRRSPGGLRRVVLRPGPTRRRSWAAAREATSGCPAVLPCSPDHLHSSPMVPSHRRPSARACRSMSFAFLGGHHGS